MAAARLDFKNYRLPATLLAVLFVVSATNSLRAGWDRFDEMLHGQNYVNAGFDLDTLTLKVVSLQPEAEESGLQSGDNVVGINGRPIRGWSDIWSPVVRAGRGDHLILRIQRAENGHTVEKNIELPLRRFDELGYLPGSAAYVITFLFRILTPLFCLALGFWVAAVRVNDRAAWALLVLMLSVSNLIVDDRTAYGHQDVLQPILTGLTFTFIRLGPLALVYFGIVFPEALGIDQKFPWGKWVVIGPMLVRAVLSGFAGGGLLHNRAIILPLWVLTTNPIGTYVELGLILLFFFLLLYKTLTAKGSDARRRFLLLDTGAVIGFLPLVTMLTLVMLLHADFRDWPALVSIAALLIFPLTMAYVIVVHRAMDVGVVLRQGLQYLLATSGVRVLQLTISAGIIVLAATITANSIAARVILIAAGFALLAGLGAFADHLRRWIDRRFFREAYEADKIMADLASEVCTIVETKSLLETVATRVSEALHVSQIAILINGNGAFRPAHAVGYAVPLGATFTEQSLTLQQVRQSLHTRVEFEGAESWAHLTGREERAALEELKPELLLPLSLKEKLLGIMSLGPKQSEEPFSPTDLRLLDLVAAQTGMALENGRLTEVIKEEARAREKQNREIELGREVQNRLFPQVFPSIRGFDYAGACRPALGVGGDYYDFIPMANGGLGIAIGDVSGKGISAALLMATLRAFVRGQAIDERTDLSFVIAKLNRLVFESSAHNRYATFFLGTYDPSAQVLKYVNAGHNAPIVIRASGEVLRLDAGGCVVGLMNVGTWEGSQIKLDRGDKLIAFTDGISEAMNIADEEWGEERLLSTVCATQESTANGILDYVMRSADEFVADAPQFDDMTLIIACAN